MKKKYFGLDGCRDGWVAACLNNGRLSIEFYETILKFIQVNPDMDECLIDMAIGFPSCKEQVRPEKAARKLLKKRGVTVFSVPCRQVVESVSSKESAIQNKDHLKKLNKGVLDVSLTQQTLAIIPKMAEIDSFLKDHPEYKNRICESHPEVCFARLNGNRAVDIKKTRREGLEKRIELLKQHLELGELDDMPALVKKGNCKPDDVMDAVCLAVAAKYKAEGKYDCIHGQVPLGEEKRLVDNCGLKMQMIIPAIGVSENT